MFFAGLFVFWNKSIVTSKSYLASVCLLAEPLKREILNVIDIAMFLMAY